MATDENTTLPKGAEAHLLGTDSEKSVWTANSMSIYKRSTRVAAIATATITLINLALTIWGLVSHGGSNPYLAIYQGDCGTAAKLEAVLHLVINALGTSVLCASSYCMQCLCAPTREEVDKAHASRRFLSVGVMSVTNLKHVSRARMMLWGLLALTSTPIHVLYNSAIYSSVCIHDYNVIFAAPDFLVGKKVDTTRIPDWPSDPDTGNISNHLDGFQNLSKHDCIRAYAEEAVTDRSTVVAITANTTVSAFMNNYTVYSWASEVNMSRNYSDSIFVVSLQTYQPGASINCGWVCARPDGGDYETSDENYPTSSNPKSVENWRPSNFDVEYCLSKSEKARCALHFNTLIMMLVTVCNILKAFVMFYIAFSDFKQPLMVVGDAVASFLHRPDDFTDEMCWAGSKAFYGVPRTQPLKRGPRIWKETAKRRHSGQPGGGWGAVFMIMYVLLLTGLIMFIEAATSLAGRRSYAGSSPWTSGFGMPTSDVIVTEWPPLNLPSATTQVLASVLLVNLPQFFLSIPCFMLNGLWTRMYLTMEWDAFGVGKRKSPAKTLRLSQPRGEQRKTFFLQLPYRAAIPLAVASGLMHWLVSQSSYLVIFSEWSYGHYMPNPKLYSNSDWKPASLTAGFGTIALLCSVLLGSLMVLTTFTLYFLPLTSSIPAAGSCSGAIAAACHPPPGEDYSIGTDLKPLQWGVTRSAKTESDVGHCGFPNEHAETPVVGMMYA